MPDNFGLDISKDGKHVTIYELREADSKQVKFPVSGKWGNANDSTSWVPVNGSRANGAPGERLFSVPQGAAAALVGRGFNGVDVSSHRKHILVSSRPSDSFRALSEQDAGALGGDTIAAREAKKDVVAK